jgi:hypothetical protein
MGLVPIDTFWYSWYTQCSRKIAEAIVMKQQLTASIWQLEKVIAHLGIAPKR